MVHDKTNGHLAMLRKEEIATQIEEQLLLGHGDLLDEDQYLLEVNLGDLRDSTGERQEYWLLAIQAARVAGSIALDRLPADERITGSPYRPIRLSWTFGSPLYPWVVPWIGRHAPCGP